MKLRHEVGNPYYPEKAPREIHRSQLSLRAWGLIAKLYERSEAASESDCKDLLIHNLSTELGTPSGEIFDTLEELLIADIVSTDRRFRFYAGCGWRVWIPTPPDSLEPFNPGYVYAMHNTANDLIKIGRTKELNQRHAVLAREHGLEQEDLRVLGIVYSEDCCRLESELHSQFSKYRVRRTEWFNLMPRLNELASAVARDGYYCCFHPEGIVL